MDPAAILSGIGEVLRQHLGWEGALSMETRLVEDLRLLDPPAHPGGRG